jgi:hypothetical protein
MISGQQRVIGWFCRWGRRWRVFGSFWRSSPLILRFFLPHGEIAFLSLVLTMSANDNDVNSWHRSFIGILRLPYGGFR